MCVDDRRGNGDSRVCHNIENGGEWPEWRRRDMPITLLYHDVIQDDFDESGFLGSEAVQAPYRRVCEPPRRVIAYSNDTGQ